MTDYHDPLTGLPNEILFADRVGQALALASRYKRKVALLRLQLDLEPEPDNALLRAIVERLLSELRATDSVMRSEGNFLILLNEADSTPSVNAVAEELLLTLRKPGLPSGASLDPRVAIAIFPDDGADAEALLKVLAQQSAAAATA